MTRTPGRCRGRYGEGAQWEQSSPTSSCPEDIDNDLSVGVSDILDVLGILGASPIVQQMSTVTLWSVCPMSWRSSQCLGTVVFEPH